MVREKKAGVTFMGNPLTLVGNDVQVGDKAPDFEAIDNELSPVTLASFRNRLCIISSVPSLDTPVCDMEVKRFNEEVGKLDFDVAMLTISMDLPFAQKRWCGDAGAGNVKAVSDHRDASFGKAYGVLIKELRLLARAVFVVDKNGVIQYRELVKEITKEPDYDGALDAVKALAGK